MGNKRKCLPTIWHRGPLQELASQSRRMRRRMAATAGS